MALSSITIVNIRGEKNRPMLQMRFLKSIKTASATRSSQVGKLLENDGTAVVITTTVSSVKYSPLILAHDQYP